MKKFAFSLFVIFSTTYLYAQQNVEEVIVTATKTEKTLQEVPVAVSVVTADTIEKANITDIYDLRSIVPALDSRRFTTPTEATYVIRGFGNGSYNPGIEPSVAVFIDGVYRSSMQAQIADLPAIERIEVLRGPQSTLFGKNATAGVINVVTKKPSFDESGYVSTSIGSNNMKKFKYYKTGGSNPEIIELDTEITADPGVSTEVLLPNQTNKIYFEFDKTAGSIKYRINNMVSGQNNFVTLNVNFGTYNIVSDGSEIALVGATPDNAMRGKLESGSIVGNSIQAKFYRFFYYNSNMTTQQKNNYIYDYTSNQIRYYDNDNTTDALYFEDVDPSGEFITNQTNTERPAYLITNFGGNLTSSVSDFTSPENLINKYNTEPLSADVALNKFSTLANYKSYTDNHVEFSRNIIKLEPLVNHFKVVGYEAISDLILALKTYSEAIEKQEAHVKQSVVHKGLISYDFNLAGYTKNTRTSSSARLKSGSYDGIWTGVNAYKILSTIDQGIKRCFVIGKGLSTATENYTHDIRSKYKNVIREITTDNNNDAKDKFKDYERSITQTYTSRLMPYKSENTYIDAPFIYKHLDEFVLFLSELEGDISANIFVKTDVINKFTQIGTLTLKAPLMTNNDPQTLGASQNRTMLRLKDFTEQYESSTNLPIRNGNEFQFKVEWTGKMSIRRILTSARQISQPREENIETSSAVFPLDTSQDFSYGSLNN